MGQPDKSSIQPSTSETSLTVQATSTSSNHVNLENKGEIVSSGVATQDKPPISAPGGAVADITNMPTSLVPPVLNTTLNQACPTPSNLHSLLTNPMQGLPQSSNIQQYQAGAYAQSAVSFSSSQQTYDAYQSWLASQGYQGSMNTNYGYGVDNSAQQSPMVYKQWEEYYRKMMEACQEGAARASAQSMFCPPFFAVVPVVHSVECMVQNPDKLDVTCHLSRRSHFAHFQWFPKLGFKFSFLRWSSSFSFNPKLSFSFSSKLSFNSKASSCRVFRAMLPRRITGYSNHSGPDSWSFSISSNRSRDVDAIMLMIQAKIISKFCIVTVYLSENSSDKSGSIKSQNDVRREILNDVKQMLPTNYVACARIGKPRDLGCSSLHVTILADFKHECDKLVDVIDPILGTLTPIDLIWRRGFRQQFQFIKSTPRSQNNMVILLEPVQNPDGLVYGRVLASGSQHNFESSRHPRS
ncbi:unnamed protein product [Nesidiocoris tenuis]|uniref:Uncharacterized protein n=1 Tax=Nesidiocoris tenuis TaxID=355587 RepID=A0A6H5GK97_9HEMI|nr:unnamed protein product [Nesidiocoris tenuis]